MILKLIRSILGKLILAWDQLTPPRSIQRSPESQAKVDQETRSLALYQYESCPFCVKVRRQIKRLGLQIELRDALNHPQHKKDLIEQGGMEQVPCLRIGTHQWLYESTDINEYLQKRFGE